MALATIEVKLTQINVHSRVFPDMCPEFSPMLDMIGVYVIYPKILKFGSREASGSLLRLLIRI